MITANQRAFLANAYQSAKVAGHIFPAAAACEAADESSWGCSQLAKQANNLFGQKLSLHSILGSIELPTREFLSGHWVAQDAQWVVFPSLADCFKSRMATLKRLAPSYPHYASALAAGTPEAYLTEVSWSWSTNPTRAADCIAILHAHSDLFV